MCLIVYSPGKEPEQKIDFTETDFACAWESNPHGVGFMWPEDGKIQIRKTQKKEKALKLFRALKDKPNLGIHFRYRTHGEKDISNVHPFQVLNLQEDGVDLWMMHNGVLSVYEAKKQFSDTWHFARNYLRPILKGDWNFIFTSEFDDLISPHIRGSKLLFIYANDKFEGHLIFNQKDGYLLNGDTWVSNKSYYNNYYASAYWDTQSRWDNDGNYTHGCAAVTAGGSRIIGGPKDDTFYSKDGERMLTAEDLFTEQEVTDEIAQYNLKLIEFKRRNELDDLQTSLTQLDIAAIVYEKIGRLSDTELEEYVRDKPDQLLLFLEVWKERHSFDDFGFEIMELTEDLENEIKKYDDLASLDNALDKDVA